MPQKLDVMRSETKYLISAAEAARLCKKLKAFLLPDGFNGDEYYTVRSLYFDTPDSDDMFDNDVGAYYRHKLRLRIYDVNQDRAKLELKEKTGSVQRKRSVWVTRAMAKRIASGDFSALGYRNEPFLDELYALTKEKIYRPLAVVEYERRAFTYPIGDVRVTFDRKVRANRSSFDIFDPDMQFTPVYPDVVMEVKYTGFLPEFISDLLSDHNPVRSSVSKYYLSAEEFE